MDMPSVADLRAADITNLVISTADAADVAAVVEVAVELASAVAVTDTVAPDHKDSVVPSHFLCLLDSAAVTVVVDLPSDLDLAASKNLKLLKIF